MKFQRIVTGICGIFLLLILILSGCFWYRYKMMHQIYDYQPMRIMVDRELYTHGGGVQKEKPDGQPDGTITEVIEPVAYPQKDGQANFGPVGTSYWKVMGAVVVETDQYRIFRP